MRVGAIAETLVERVGLASGLVPTPFVDSWATFILARTIMVGVSIGVFEALEAGPLTAPEIAARCGSDARATAKLLAALAASRYLEAGGTRYALAPVARKWLLASSPDSMRDVVLLRFVDWNWLGELERFVRRGEPVDMHARMTPEEWRLYQRGMRALARASADAVVDATAAPAGITRMLDVGGSHGAYAAAFCRRHPALRAVVLDLPAALAEAAPLLAEEGLGDRVVHRAGDAVTDDLGAAEWDLVLCSQVLHLFAEPVCRDVVHRAARALRQGGRLVVFDVMRPERPAAGGQSAALLDLYFALVSDAGTWSYEEIAGWQRDAGLVPRRPVGFLRLSGLGVQVAVKPR